MNQRTFLVLPKCLIMNHALKPVLLLLLFCLLSSSILTAQSYNEGQYSFRFLSLELLQPLDSTTVSTMEREMSKLSTGIAYRDSQVVLITFDRLGEILGRMVILPYEQRAFNLEYREIGPVYDTSAWSKANRAFNLTKSMVAGMAVDSVGPKVHKVKEFDCRYVRFSSGLGSYIDTYMTDQITYPRLTREAENEADVFDTLALVKIEAEVNGEFIMNFGIDTFYTEIKNPEWFSTKPPKGAMIPEDMEKAKQAIGETLESITGEKQEEGQGVNLDLVARLHEVGLISDYEYEDRVKRQRSTDRLTLITASISNYEATKWDSLIHILEQTEILTPEETADLQSKITKMPVLEKKRFEDLVVIWMLKDMLADPVHRQMLVRNLEQLDCYEIDDDIRAKGAAFAKGELSLMQYLFSLPQFKPLPRQGTRLHKNQLPEIISYLIASAIPELKEEIKIEPTQAEGELYYMIRTTDEVYRLPTGAFGQDANAANTDSILIDNAVYAPIINIIKQIIADKGLKRVCSVMSIVDRLPRFLNQKEYDWVITQRPDLKLFDQPYYLNVYPEGKYDWLICDIPISFPLEQEQALQATFRDFMSGDFSEYLPSANKRKFIAFLRQEQQDLGMTTVDIDALEENMMGRLVLNVQYYIKTIPDIHVTLGIFDEWPAASLEEQPTFKEAFPRLHRLLDGTVEVENLRPDASGEALMLMDVNGKTVKVKEKWSFTHSEKEGLMQAIQPFLAEKEMGIFTFNTLLKERTYYLLTYELRKTLEDIFSVRFVRV